MNFPSDLKYTKEHEWIRLSGDVATIGITDYAQKELGDIVYVDITTVGETVPANGVFGTVEAVKTVSDLYMPIEAEVLEFNEALGSEPDSVNKDPYNTGWMIKARVKNTADVANLMSADEYKKLIGA